MKELTKLARDLIGTDHQCQRLRYPYGVACRSVYGHTPLIIIRTGHRDSTHALMKRAIQDIGALRDRGLV